MEQLWGQRPPACVPSQGTAEVPCLRTAAYPTAHKPPRSDIHHKLVWSPVWAGALAPWGQIPSKT